MKSKQNKVCMETSIRIGFNKAAKKYQISGYIPRVFAALLLYSSVALGYPEYGHCVLNVDQNLAKFQIKESRAFLQALMPHNCDLKEGFCTITWQWQIKDDSINPLKTDVYKSSTVTRLMWITMGNYYFDLADFKLNEDGVTPLSLRKEELFKDKRIYKIEGAVDKAVHGGAKAGNVSPFKFEISPYAAPLKFSENPERWTLKIAGGEEPISNSDQTVPTVEMSCLVSQFPIEEGKILQLEKMVVPKEKK